MICNIYINPLIPEKLNIIFKLNLKTKFDIWDEEREIHLNALRRVIYDVMYWRHNSGKTNPPMTKKPIGLSNSQPLSKFVYWL